MKLSAYLFAIFTAIVAQTASATTSSAQCKQQCDLPAVVNQFTTAGAKSGLAAYKYGRYCGAANFDKINRDPCNDIDKACQEHDTCYADNGVSSGDIPPSDTDQVNARCECNNAFIGALLDEYEAAVFAATTGINACEGEELCTSNVGCDYVNIALLQSCLFCLIQLQDSTPLPFDYENLSFVSGTKTTATCVTASAYSLSKCGGLYDPNIGSGACATVLANYLA